MNNLVSVIIPVYNGEKYIRQAVNSLLCQTYFNIEVLILDDGSIDDTYTICKGISVTDSRVKLISRENKGLVRSLNELLSLAKGRYIARMDADDICSPDRVRIQYEFLSNTSFSFCGASVKKIDLNGCPIGDEKLSYSITLLRAKALFSPAFYHPSVMFDRKRCGSELYYDEKAKHCEDFELWSRLLKNNKLGANLDSFLLYYRMHNNNVSRVYATEQTENSKLIMVNNFVYWLHINYNDAKQLSDIVSFRENYSLFSKLRLIYGITPAFVKKIFLKDKLFVFYSWLIMLRRVVL